MTMWIEELSNGKYKYVERYEDPLTGKMHKVSLTSTKHNARVEKEMTKRLLQKIEHKKSHNVIENIKFNQLADEWLSLYQQRVKPSTYVTTKNTLNAILAEFSDFKLKKIRPAHINQFLLERHAEGIGATTLSIYKSLFERLFKHEEFARFTLLMANLGTRFGELASVRFEDIDFEENKINIDRTFSRVTYDYQTPKTGTRQIYFHDDMKPVLREQIKYAKMKLLRQGHNKNNTLLFKNNRNTPIVVEKYNRELKQFKDGLTSHWLRHTYISLMVEQGVNTRIIAEQVGHADTTMIDQIYSHFTQTMKQQQKEMQKQFKVL